MLYIVGTPIGNLDDLSLRQAKTIAEAEIILSEDTRSTGMLLQRIRETFCFTLDASPCPRLISYYKEKEFEKLPEVMDMLREDKNVVLISQAGMPVISDPGLLLIRTVIKENLPFIVIPGPTAASTALVYSGFLVDHVLHLGFLPKKGSQLRSLLGKLKQTAETLRPLTVVAYDSPMRVNETLKIMAETVPNAKICVARELTKKFEEIVRGTPEKLSKRTYKGEVTIVIEL